MPIRLIGWRVERCIGCGGAEGTHLLQANARFLEGLDGVYAGQRVPVNLSEMRFLGVTVGVIIDFSRSA
jgi:hypothetical protein